MRLFISMKGIYYFITYEKLFNPKNIFKIKTNVEHYNTYK